MADLKPSLNLKGRFPFTYRTNADCDVGLAEDSRLAIIDSTFNIYLLFTVLDNRTNLT